MPEGDPGRHKPGTLTAFPDNRNHAPKPETDRRIPRKGEGPGRTNSLLCYRHGPVQAQLRRLWAVLAVGLVAGAVLLPSPAGADSDRRGEPRREVGAVPPQAREARRISVQASGYALKGTTATGIPVGWGIVAVDPSTIPLGTPMTIPGYGRGVAADIGSSVRGARIDLWFPTRAKALAWGRRTVTITLH